MTVDTLRYDATGFSGSGKVRTPLLDRLATAGREFTFAHAQTVMTLPSHASILTGLYPYQHGIRDNSGFVLDRGIPTLASMLKQAGYATAAFVSAFPLDRRFGLDAGFDVYDDECQGFSARISTLAERPGEETIALAKAWWEGHRQGPRFLWVHLFAPHFPYEPREPFATRYRSAPYYGEAAMVDDQLGPLLGPLLDEGGSRTIVIFTSDHGEALGEHGERTHGIFAYESTLKVPLVIWAPGLVTAGKDDRLARHVDIVPTVLDLLGLQVASRLPGSTLLAPVPPGKDPGSYFETLTTYLNRGWAPLRGRIEGKTKAIELPIPELYELDKDPGEADDLAARQADLYRSIVARIPAEAKSAGRRGAPDADAVAKLKSLGYVVSTAPANGAGSLDASADPKRLVGIDREMEDAVDRFHKGDPAGGIRAIRALIARQPRMAPLYSHLATMYADSGRPGEAIDVLGKAVSLGIASESMKVNLARGLADQGKTQAAWDMVSGFAESSDPETQDALGIIAAKSGRPADAQAYFQKALALDPTYPSARVDLSVLYLNQGRYEEAKTALTQALRENSFLPDGWNAMGAILAKEGNLSGAVKAWERAVKLNPKLAIALYNLALASNKLGDYEKAASALERLVPLAPEKQRRQLEAMLQAVRQRARAKAS